MRHGQICRCLFDGGADDDGRAAGKCAGWIRYKERLRGLLLGQIIANGIIAGCAYVLMATSFVVIYRVTKFFHFAHGMVYTFGAYAAYATVTLSGAPLACAVICGVAASMILGLALEWGIYRHLRRRRSGTLVLLLASLGIYGVLQNAVSIAFGDDVKSLSLGNVSEGAQVLSARVTPVQFAIVAAAIGALVLLSIMLKTTRFGKALRAVASDPELAQVRGVDTNRIILGAFALGSGLAGLAGILAALDVNMTPTMGLNALMMGVIAMIVGGTSNLLGILLGGLMLGLAQNLAVWRIGSEWQDSMAFLVLVAFVLLRPQGILGKLSQKSRI